MLHQLFQLALPEVVEELLQVGPGCLGPGSNSHCSAVIVVSAGAGLEDVWALVVIACHKESNAIGPLSISLSANLHFVAQISDHTGDWQRCVMAISRVEALVAHPPRDCSGISGESGDGHANMVIDGKDLFLMTGKFTAGSLERNKDCVSVALNSHRG